MIKRNNKTAHIVTAVCLLAAAIILIFLITNLAQSLHYGRNYGNATQLEFKITGQSAEGFERKATLYADQAMTSVSFTGRLTVDGTAVIEVSEKEGGAVIYQETFSDLNESEIRFAIHDLSPETYYILRFASSDAKSSYLLLTTDQSLAERPKRIKPLLPKRR